MKWLFFAADSSKSWVNKFYDFVNLMVVFQNARRIKVDGTSFSDAGSLVTTVHLTREICPRDVKYRESKTNIGAQKLLLTRCFLSCLSEIGSKQKLSFERQLLSNSVCVR